MSEIPPVFISYPRDGASGQALARELYQRLSDQSIPVFLDEKSIRFGDRWPHTLSKGIELCKIMLSVISPASHDRSWMEKEYIAACEAKVLTIPVKAAEGKLPLLIIDLQAADLFGDNKEAQWELVLERIREELPDTPQETNRQAEINYLNDLLLDNEDRALGFASEVYTPLGVNKLHKERRRIAVAAMSPLLRHRKRTQYDEPQETSKVSDEYGDILAAFKEHKRLVILGEPGSGKTFSLWRIAAEQAQLALENSNQALPVVIPLNRWDDPELSLHDFILQQLDGLAGSFLILHKAKRLLPLFDALNEIPFDQRDNKLPQIRSWLKKYTLDLKNNKTDPLNKNKATPVYRPCLLTCRERDYRGPLEQDIDRLMIQPLDPPRIYSFLHNYFTEDQGEYAMAESLFWQLAGGDRIRQEWQCLKNNDESNSWEKFWAHSELKNQQKAKSINDRLEDSRSMMKLASNPYLLTQIAVLFDHHGRLPESRIELFTHFVEDLIFREMTDERSENYYPKANQEKLRIELRKLAWQLQSRTGSMEEARTTLLREEAEKLMPLTRLEFSAAASLLELSPKSVRFSHQLLQEFFTAQSFTEQIVSGLKASELWNPKTWWEANGWEEAAKLAAEYEADPLDLIHWLAEGNPHLAVEIARELNLLGLKDALFLDYKYTWQSVAVNTEKYPNPYERHSISTILAFFDWDERVGIGVNNAQLPDIDWVEIPRGAFIFGDVYFQKSASINTYYISRYPVTNEQFQAFVNAGGYQTEKWWEGLDKPDNLPNHRWLESNRPVESVSWYECTAFCRWLSTESGEDIRLPSVLEWEKAARGAKANQFPWGNDYLSGFANISESSRYAGFHLGETSAVGIYPQAKSTHGVMDMSGNVWDWCLNKNDRVPSVDDRIIRGGSWDNYPDPCRASFFSSRSPKFRDQTIGFRLVRPVITEAVR